ncbi:hypothetical protein [Ileibacterium valens]
MDFSLQANRTQEVRSKRQNDKYRPAADGSGQTDMKIEAVCRIDALMIN